MPFNEKERRLLGADSIGLETLVFELTTEGGVILTGALTGDATGTGAPELVRARRSASRLALAAFLAATFFFLFQYEINSLPQTQRANACFWLNGTASHSPK